MPQPIIPWEPCNFPSEIQNELNRRKTNRSFNYVNSDTSGWNEKTGDWQKYLGPMSPWVRFCSNGLGRTYKTDTNGKQLVDRFGNPIQLDASEYKPGFVFFGGKNFYNGYGFSKNDGNSSIIGYVPDKANRTHVITNDLNSSNYPIHVPPPEIEKIGVTIQKELYRRATIEWVCFSKAQLEYMTPYFLIPGISCVLEWGWNHYNPASLINLSNTDRLKKYFNNPYPLYNDHILISNGNYDVTIGIITHFEWSVDGNKIKCKTEITSKDRIYAGLLAESNVTDISTTQEKPMDSIKSFVEKVLPKFKEVKSDGDPTNIPVLGNFIKYLSDKYPNDKWKEYAYGIFYGRDIQDGVSTSQYSKPSEVSATAYQNGRWYPSYTPPIQKTTVVKKDNPLQKGADTTYDFDYKNGKNKELWLNLGLVIEAINYHSAPLIGLNGKEMFRIDIDDVVIGGHPNMISSDGGILLIPNAEAPKYFYGLYGPNYKPDTAKDISENIDWKTLEVCTNPVIPSVSKEDSEKKGMLADYRVKSVCLQSNGAHRDDLDQIINRIRYDSGAGTGNRTYEFPLKKGDINATEYPIRYSGYLKNLYVNLNFITSLLKRSEIQTHYQLIEKILEGINSACGNFWDFRIVQSTGKHGIDDKIATMKIVDYKFMSSVNRGEVFTFDYFDSDSILLGMGFKPTISNAQAIRSIYAPTNNPNKKCVITNGANELLDYHFKDRLFQENESIDYKLVSKNTSGFRDTMRSLQNIIPFNGAYQITNEQDGKRYVRRLVMPNPEILNMLLDDGDEENNPKYTGIMPGIQASFTLQGIGGLRTFMMFLVRNLPEPYSHHNIVFRIVDVQESIDNGKWTTTITAGIIPLREHIKKRLGITAKTN